MTKLYCYIMSIPPALKIGVSKDPNTRLESVRSAQVPTPLKRKLELVAFWESSTAEERFLHRLLRDYQYHIGPHEEWFIRCNKVKALLKNYLRSIDDEKSVKLHMLRLGDLSHNENERDVITDEFAGVAHQADSPTTCNDLWCFKQKAFLEAASTRFVDPGMLAHKLGIPEGQLHYIIGGWRPPRHIRIAVTSLLGIPQDRLWAPVTVLPKRQKIIANSPVDDLTEST